MNDRAGEHPDGRIERLLARLYARIGSRIAVLCVVIGYVFGLVTLAEVTAGGARYLDLSVDQTLSLWPVALIVIVITAIGLSTRLGQLRTVLGWRGDDRTTARAPETWYALVQWRHMVTAPIAGAELALLPTGIYVVSHFHRPWYMVVVGVTAFSGVLASLWALTTFTHALILRPMVEDVAAHLPPEFEPATRGLSLRAKTVGPLPVVTFFAALVVGAYANLTNNPAERAALASGVALATVVVATVIFLILNRSVLAPIDDLIAATERVRAGDITTPVPIASDDELGQLAVSFNQMLEELRTTRKRIVSAADAARRRVERDLHDGAQQQLVLAQLKLASANKLLDSSPAEARATLDGLRDDLARALRELRDLAQGLYPPVLESDGLGAALREAIERAAIPVAVDFDSTDARRYDAELEAAVYFCCLEALQNAAKHGGQNSTARLRLGESKRGENGRLLWFAISDNGPGFDRATARRSSGLQNMSDRIGALGGSLQIDSHLGSGTTVIGSVPLEQH